MEVVPVVKQPFSVIGKEGQGSAEDGGKWVPPLWQSAKARFREIADLVKKDEDGNPAGIWGVMSDISGSFNPWDGRGKYLAGCEAPEGAAVPPGWAKWTVPGYKYLTVRCRQEEYGEVFGEMLGCYIPKHGYKLMGAVHEFYDPRESGGFLHLYFPVEKL